MVAMSSVPPHTNYPFCSNTAGSAADKGESSLTKILIVVLVESPRALYLVSNGFNFRIKIQKLQLIPLSKSLWHPAQAS